MDATRFDRFTRHLSRRGLVATIGAGLLGGRASGALASHDQCGGQATRYTKYCPHIRTCQTDDDCSPSCACIERRTGCCFSERKRRRKGRRRKCVTLFGKYCTPQSAVRTSPARS